MGFRNGRAPRSPVLLAALLLLACCTTMFTPRTQRAGSSAVVIPNMPMLQWGIESCGAGSLATVLQHYGNATTMHVTTPPAGLSLEYYRNVYKDLYVDTGHDIYKRIYKRAKHLMNSPSDCSARENNVVLACRRD